MSWKWRVIIDFIQLFQTFTSVGIFLHKYRNWSHVNASLILIWIQQFDRLITPFYKHTYFNRSIVVWLPWMWHLWTIPEEAMFDSCYTCTIGHHSSWINCLQSEWYHLYRASRKQYNKFWLIFYRLNHDEFSIKSFLYYRAVGWERLQLISLDIYNIYTIFFVIFISSIFAICRKS